MFSTTMLLMAGLVSAQSSTGCVLCTCKYNSGGYYGTYTDCGLWANGRYGSYGPMKCYTDLTYWSHGTCPLTSPSQPASTLPPVSSPATGTASSVGDPITIYQGKSTRYWLPNEEMTKVFSQGTLEVAFQRGTQNRKDWVTKIEVRSSGMLIANISTIDPSTLLSPLAIETEGLLTTMDLWMDLQINGTAVAGKGKWALPGNVSMTVQPSIVKSASIGSGYVDRIIINAKDFELHVFTAKARKMTTEEERILGLHLDVEWAHFNKETCVGLLPEMWGLRNMSALAKQMLEDPANNQQQGFQAA